MKPPCPKDDLPNYRNRLLAWYRNERRSLPWREEVSVYRTIVSEFMLQQTQVKTVLPYFERWMLQFPDLATLADAEENAVLKAWEGLGYYSRARNLHRLAKALVERNGMPQIPTAWEAMPGIGPYTAAAIASIAQDYPVAVVDGNVVRVLSRLLGDETVFANSGEAVKYFRKAAETYLSGKHPGDYNQAIMELGATICVKNKPLCTICPVVAHCAGAAMGTAATLPRIQRPQTIKRDVERFVLVVEGRILLQRISGDAKRLAGQTEFPESILCPDWLRLEAKPYFTRKRGIANEIITEHFHRASVTEQPIGDSPKALYWVSVDDLGKITLSGPHRRWLKPLLNSFSAETEKIKII